MLSIVVHWGDVARWLVEAAPLLVGGVGPSGALWALFAAEAGGGAGDRPDSRYGGLARRDGPAGARAVSNYGFLIAMVMFLFWFTAPGSTRRATAGRRRCADSALSW